MNNKHVTLAIALLLIVAFFSGCIETRKESTLLLNSLSFTVDDFEGDWELLYEDYVDIPYIEKDRAITYDWYILERFEYAMILETDEVYYQFNLLIFNLGDEADYKELTYEKLKDRIVSTLDDLINESIMEYEFDVAHEEIGDLSHLLSIIGSYMNLYILSFKISNILVHLLIGGQGINGLPYDKESIINFGRIIENKINNILKMS